MPKKYNGRIRDSLDMYKPEKNAVGDLASGLEIFRGFEKVARVSCERIDIRPFLHKKRKMEDLAPDLREPTFVAVHEISKFAKKCTVQVKRENLEKLKEEFMSYSNGSYVSDTKNVVHFTCNICQKVYLSEKKLLNHQENKHVLLIRPESKIRKKVSFSDEIIVHEVKEYHRCRKCPKIFENYKSLRGHMKEVHKKRRCYICFYCSKDFVDRTFFKVHMKLHCDLCGLLFPNKKSYNEHRRESDTCKIIKKYECKTCHIIVFHFLDLKDHSYEHLGDFYICDICKDRFDDKCALSHHIRFLHSKRRPKDLYTTQIDGGNTIYSCSFCEHTASERTLILKHVSTFPEYEKCAMTGYSDFYFCDQCFEKFSTETDMLAHKWTHYLKTAENNPQDTPRPINLLNTETLCNSKNSEPLNNKENTTEAPKDDVTQNNSNMKSQALKRYYNINEVPALFQPKVVLERLILPNDKIPDSSVTDVDNVDLTKPIVAEKKKRILVKNHKCELCLKLFTTNYIVKRHMVEVHGIQKESLMSFMNTSKGKLRCADCEEDFALPSLLQNHNCIRINRPEPPFQDARPEIQLDTPDVYHHNRFDDIISLDDDDDDYMNAVDFDIPAPIVELTEYDNTLVINNDESIPNVPVNVPVRNNSFNVNSNNVAAYEGQLSVKPPVRQYTNTMRSHCRFNRPLNSTTVNDVHLNRPLINDQLNRPLNNATGNVTRFTRPSGNTNNAHLKRLLNTSPAPPLNNPVANNAQPNRLLNNAVNNAQFTRPLNNATVNNARFTRPINNATVNNARFTRPINNATVNNARFTRPINNANVNNARFTRPINNANVNNAQFTRPLNNATINDAWLNRPNNATVNNSRLIRPLINATVNDARFNTSVNDARLNRPLNGLPISPSINGERINVQLNVGGKQNQYTLVVQEVPIEF